MQADCPRCGHPHRGAHQTNGCGMTLEIALALRQFRAANGVRWKSKLRELWMRGADEGVLRQARNVVGPGGRRLEKIQRTYLS